MKTETFDPIGYESLIKEIFPKALIERIINFDDIHYGWKIAPKPGVCITFRVDISNDMRIIINVEEVLNGVLYEKKLFNGVVPANKDSEPDFDFVGKLLKNYQSIG